MNREPENLLDLLGEDAPSNRMRSRLQQDIAAERQRSRRRRNQRRTWAVAAVLLLVVGFGIGRRLPGTGDRAGVVIEALAADSALRRAQGARASTELTALPAKVQQRLETLLRSDPDTNVRLAVMYALAARDTEAGIRAILLDAVAAEETPLLQAHLVGSLQRGSQVLSPMEIERLQALDGLAEAARSRLVGS